MEILFFLNIIKITENILCKNVSTTIFYYNYSLQKTTFYCIKLVIFYYLSVSEDSAEDTPDSSSGKVRGTAGPVVVRGVDVCLVIQLKISDDKELTASPHTEKYSIILPLNYIFKNSVPFPCLPLFNVRVPNLDQYPIPTPF